MTFAEPQYAWILFALPLLALLKIAADLRAQKAMAAFAASERLRNALLGGASPVWSGLHFGLQVLGLAFFIIALTRPQLGTVEREIQETGRSIFIAIDTSKSMLAEDVKPNRLTRAKLAAHDLLEKLAGDRVGLIAFAGRAFLQAPLTTDHDAVVESIQSLDHTTIPRGGSSLAAAIKLALQTMEKAGGGQHGMILFTDGQETDDAILAAAREAAEKHLLVLPVGVGTVPGDVIPDPEPEPGNAMGYVTDASGNIVHSRLEAEVLRQVAQITGGEYIELGAQALTRPLVERLLQRLESHESGTKQESRKVERYQWPLSLGILCLALSLFLRPSSRKRLRRVAPLPMDPQASVHAGTFGGRAAALMAALLLPWGAAAWAAVGDDVAQARKDYQNGNYRDAADAYGRLLHDHEHRLPREELAYGLGAAQMKLGEDDQAIKAFSDALRSPSQQLQMRSLRALGNVLYEKGKKLLAKEPGQTVKAWEDALSHLGTALQQPGADKEVHENYDFVKEQLEKLKQQQEQQKQKQQDKGKQQPQQGKGQPEEGEGQGGQQEQPPQQEDGERREPQQQDAMQEGEQQVPEGQVSAGEAGEKPEEQQQGVAQEGQEKEQQRNEETGFSPQEARSQLRNYADDQNSVQYLMRRERPQGGKDY